MNRNTRTLAQMALLVAILAVLNFTPFGFLQIGVMAITFMHIPVLIGAMNIGPLAGGVLGAFFGVFSMITATMRGTPTDIVFTPFLSGSLWSVVIAMVPRILFGIFTAYIYQALSKTKLNRRVVTGISAGIGSLLHTVMVLGSILLFVGDMYAQNIGVAQSALKVMFATVVGTNGLVEAAASVVICVALSIPLEKASQQQS